MKDALSGSLGPRIKELAEAFTKSLDVYTGTQDPDSVNCTPLPPRMLSGEEASELRTLKTKTDLRMIMTRTEHARMKELEGIPKTGPTPARVAKSANYGTRLYPRETRSAIKMLHGQPSALSLLFAMTTCIGFGCVVNADRKKLLEITGFTASTYTRALNVLLGLGLVLPNFIGETDPQPGFILDKELPTKKNGRRYKIAPFIAFRGDKLFQMHELNKYNKYMKIRVDKLITPVQDDDDGNPEFVGAES
jgi:hypothetical protein